MGDVPSFCFRREITFMDKFRPKNQNYQLKQKFLSLTNSNIQNSMVMFTLSVFNRKHSFWANLFPKFKIVYLKWKLVPKLIQICKIQWWCPLVLFLTENILFWANLVQKTKTISFSWNLLTRLILIFKIQ